VLWIMVDGRSW